jgi:hypothetical protein
MCAPHRGHLVRKAAECRAGVVEEVDKLDHRDLRRPRAFQADVDRARSKRRGVDRVLDARAPAAITCKRHDRLLAPGMDDVARHVRARRGLEKRGELRRDRRRAGRERLDRRSFRPASFEGAPERLRNACAFGCARLAEVQCETRFPKGDPDPAGKVVAPAATLEPSDSGPPAASVRHAPSVPRRAYPAMLRRVPAASGGGRTEALGQAQARSSRGPADRCPPRSRQHKECYPAPVRDARLSSAHRKWRLSIRSAEIV